MADKDRNISVRVNERARGTDEEVWTRAPRESNRYDHALRFSIIELDIFASISDRASDLAEIRYSTCFARERNVFLPFFFSNGKSSDEKVCRYEIE